MNWGVSKSQVVIVAAFILGMSLLIWRIFAAGPGMTIPVQKSNYLQDDDVIPNLVVETLNVTASRGGTKEVILRFPRARLHSGSDGPVYQVEKPTIDMAKVGDITFTLEADEGHFDPGTGDWTLSGNVYAASGTVREFHADWARFKADQDRIVARGIEKPLRIIDRGIELEAWGLRTDRTFETIEFESARGRMEGDFLPSLGEEPADDG